MMMMMKITRDEYVVFVRSFAYPLNHLIITT